MQTIDHWIEGKAVGGTSGRYRPVFNPATGQQVARVALASSAEVEKAVRAAQGAYEGWSSTSLNRRAKVLFAFRELVDAHAEELAEIVSDEHGKVFSDALGEVKRGLEVVEFACGIPHLMKGEYSDEVSTGVDVFSYHQPLGVVAGISPFNFPVMVPMWMHPIAIACGNSFVLKPSEQDPSASLRVAQLWAEAGLPDGVFSVVNGDKFAVDCLLDNPTVTAISFVGSTAVARYVHERATAAGKRVQALGGAKNHAVVLPDADLGFAADHLVAAAFGSAGERCMAISATVAVGPRGDDVVELITERASEIRVGPGRDRESEMGPVISSEARDRISGYVDRGERDGAVVCLDGRGVVVDGHEGGFFIGPTVVDQVTPRMEIYRDEIFGPVLSVLRVRTVDEAIRLINANPFGNGTALFTSSGEAARRFHRSVTVGMVGVNVPIPVPMAYYSFGGWKDSLFGERRVHGADGVDFYTKAKVVTSRWPTAASGPAASYHFPTGQ